MTTPQAALLPITELSPLPCHALRAVRERGADDVPTLDRCRRELAGWADRLGGKQRLNKRHSRRPAFFTPARADLIARLQAAYDATLTRLLALGWS